MAISPNGRTLYPMLEGALTTDPDQRRLIISEFDLAKTAYTGRRWFYQLDAAGHAIGDLTAVTAGCSSSSSATTTRAPPRSSRRSSSSISIRSTPDGFLVKFQVADLLQLADPLNIGRQGPLFRFPFQTIESVIPLGDQRARHPGRQQLSVQQRAHRRIPDPNEFIVIRLERPIVEFARRPIRR